MKYHSSVIEPYPYVGSYYRRDGKAYCIDIDVQFAIALSSCFDVRIEIGCEGWVSIGWSHPPNGALPASLSRRILDICTWRDISQQDFRRAHGLGGVGHGC